ncbi:MAG: PKD domain-containing protein [Synergistetes bacterium]|nr:PKD domain-containing protein [Synergistota bacterium]
MRILRNILIVLLSIFIVISFLPISSLAEKVLPHPFGLKRTPLKTALKYPRFKREEIKAPLKLPASVDLSSNLPPVGDQGYVGSCACWASVYYWKSYAESKEHGWSVNEPEHQFSASYIYNLVNGGTDDGSTFPDIYELMKRVGAAPITDFPNLTTDYLTLPSKEVIKRALQYKVQGLELIFARDESQEPPYSPLSDSVIKDMKALLASGEPFVIGVPIYSSFSYYIGGVYDGPFWWEELLGYHGMLVYGYDDSLSAFKVRNSWGISWGISGNCLLSYDFMKQYVCEAWRFIDAINPQIKAYLELEIDHGRLGDLIITVGKGNTWDSWNTSGYEGSYPDYYLSMSAYPDPRVHLELAMDVSSFINASGDWKLKVSDMIPSSSGKVKSAQIVVEDRSETYLLNGTGEMEIKDMQTNIGVFEESAPPSPNNPPVVGLSADPQSGYAPLTVNFTASAYDPDGDEITKYEWDFDGDGYADLTTTIPQTSWIYYFPGSYLATVKAYDSRGDWGSSSIYITVSEEPNPPPPPPEPSGGAGGGCSMGKAPHGISLLLIFLAVLPIYLLLKRRWS